MCNILLHNAFVKNFVQIKIVADNFEQYYFYIFNCYRVKLRI